MQSLLLTAILSYPVAPVCQQWLDRRDRESRTAARLVWSPQKERHIKRMNYANDQVRQHCSSYPGEDLVATATTVPANGEQAAY